MKILAVIASSLLSVAVFAADDAPLQTLADPQSALRDLQQKMSTLKSVWLEFTQERQLKMFAEPLKSEGVMLIGAPDRIRWETTAPYQSILLGNRKSVAQFERTDGEWKKLKLGFPQMLKRVMSVGAAVLIALHHTVRLAATMRPGHGSQNLDGTAAAVIGSLQTVLQIAGILAVTLVLMLGASRIIALIGNAGASVISALAKLRSAVGIARPWTRPP